MEVSLSDQDMDRLAAALEKRISDRVLGLVTMGKLGEILNQRALKLADLAVSDSAFASRAAEQMSKQLTKDGGILLRDIVSGAIKTLADNGVEIDKLARGAVNKRMAQYLSELNGYREGE